MIKLQITRRRLLAALGAAGLGLLARPEWVRALELAAIKKPVPSSGALLKPIPSSGELLPVIGMGSSRTLDVEPRSTMATQLVPVLQAFFDHGGALVDTSPMYGHAEKVLGVLLGKVSYERKQLFAATKVWTRGRQAGIDQMQRSMQLMGIERFDLIQIHNLVDWQVHLETLQEWKAGGKVRYIGITTSHGRNHKELEAALATAPFDFVQLSYNIGDRAVEQRLLPLAQERGIAVLANRPFQRGDLFSKVRGKALPDWAADIDCSSWAQFFLKFVVSHPAVTCAIPATAKLNHMVDNMGAGVGRLPDAPLRKRMLDIIESV